MATASPEGSAWAGNHGVSDSISRTTSASPTSAPASKPWQRMIPREVEMGRPGLDHRQRQAVGKLDQRLGRGRVPSQRRGDRQRVDRRRERLRGLAQRVGRGLGRTRRPEAGGRADRQGWQRRADDVGRQRQVDGAALGLPFGERFDDRRKVGAGAAPEETADAAGLQQLEQPLGHALDVQTMSRHGRVGLQLVIPLDLPAQRDRVRHVDDESVVPVLPHPTIPAHLPGTR